MPRKPRIEFPGAFYHIIVRGNHGQVVFHDDQDKKKFLSVLNDYWVKFDFTLYAFVLLDNHVHILIETQNIPLSKIMQGANQRYTQYYNLRYKQSGHLFQGRYKAILCQRDSYLLKLVSYIHLNPVRAGIVLKPSEYTWSSHISYLNNSKSEFLNTSFVLDLLSRSSKNARKKYLQFVNNHIGQQHQEDFYPHPPILGDDTFIEQLNLRFKNHNIHFKKPIKQFTLEKIATIVCGTVGVDICTLKERRRSSSISLSRSLFIFMARNYSHSSNNEIARFLGRDPALITRLVGNFKINDNLNLIEKVKISLGVGKC